MIKFILAIIAVEAITEILLHSELFGWLRKGLSKIKVFDCGWCLSVWVAMFVFAIILLGLEIVLVPIAIHRMSNVFHDIYGFLRR